MAPALQECREHEQHIQQCHPPQQQQEAHLSNHNQQNRARSDVFASAHGSFKARRRPPSDQHHQQPPLTRPSLSGIQEMSSDDDGSNSDAVPSLSQSSSMSGKVLVNPMTLTTMRKVNKKKHRVFLS